MGTPLKKMYEFPALSFIRFFSNHGLLTVTMPVQWYTVQGGSRSYVTKVVEELKKSGVKFETGAMKASRNQTIKITDSENNIKSFDKVIFACHSDEALELLEKPNN